MDSKDDNSKIEKVDFEGRNLPDKVLKKADITLICGDYDHNSFLCYNIARARYLCATKSVSGLIVNCDESFKVKMLYIKAINIDPNNGDAYCGLAECMRDIDIHTIYDLYSLDKYDIYRMAIATDPMNINYRIRLLNALPYTSEIVTETGESLVDTICKEIIDIAPEYHIAYYRIYIRHRCRDIITLLNGQKMTMIDLIITAIHYSTNALYKFCLYHLMKDLNIEIVELINGTRIAIDMCF